MYHGPVLGTDKPTGTSGKRQELSTFYVIKKLIFIPRSLLQLKTKKEFSFGKTHMDTHKHKDWGLAQ